MMNSDQIKKIFELFEAVREGTITDEQFSHLDQILAKNKQACKYYFEFINMCVNLRSRKALEEIPVMEDFPEKDDSIYDERLWQDLANDEKTAPAVHIEKPKMDSEIQFVNKAQVPKTTHEISKPLLYTAIISTAALVFLLVYVNFILPPPSQEVATLVSSVNAQWADMDGPAEIGSRLRNHQGSLWLQKGLVEIEFDYGANILIQAPANFELETAEEIYLHTGRLYAKVPSHAIGFTVHTPNSSVIDLGTEFGVKVDMDGSSDIHVFKGKTSLMLGTRGSTRQSQILSENHALRVKSNALKASEIALDGDMFIRRLPSPYEQTVLKSRPYVYWRFEDDLSGMAMNSTDESHYNGMFFGNCSLERTGPDMGDGESNTALVLDGQDSYVKFKNIVNKGTEKYSVVLWVRPDSDEAQNVIVCSGPNGPDYDFSMQLRIGINKQFEFYTLSKIHKMVGGGGKGKFTIHANDTVQVDRWYFLAVTVDENNEVRLYVDGELTASTIMNDKLFDSYPDIYIGCPAGNKRNYPEHKMGAFRGTVDDIAIYNRHLNENEIRSIYKSTQKK